MVHKSLNLESLYTLVLVLYYDGIHTRAAEALGIRPAKVRRRLAQLERDAGVPLFRKRITSRGQSRIDWTRFELTPCGRHLAAQSVPFLANIESLEQSLRMLHHRTARTA